MVDLREKVVQDRGILARIQSAIPGFSGYRANEDLRAADNMLRLQLADRLAAIRKELETCRAVLTENMFLGNLDRIGTLISKIKAIEGEVRHAGQGYSGISAKVRVGETELNNLYEYDSGLLTSLADMSGEAFKLKALAKASPPELNDGIDKLKDSLDSFETTFNRRMMVITGTEV